MFVPVIATAPVVVTFATSTWEAAVTVTLVRAVLPPIAPIKSIVPVFASIVRDCPPSIVLAKEMLPPSESKATSPVKVTAVAKEMLSDVVVMSPAVETAPAPFCVKKSESERSPPAATESVPAFVMVTAPAAIVLLRVIPAELTKVKFFVPRVNAPPTSMAPVAESPMAMLPVVDIVSRSASAI